LRALPTCEGLIVASSSRVAYHAESESLSSLLFSACIHPGFIIFVTSNVFEELFTWG
jgi:hypothetical protein